MKKILILSIIFTTAIFSSSFDLISETKKNVEENTPLEKIYDFDNSKKVADFQNYIRNFGNCGFANTGLKQYLKNKNPNKGYKVTVKTKWTRGVEKGEYENVYTINAGSEKFLGCTYSSNNPVTISKRYVIGEVEL